jgi:hypothetical protein
MGILVSDEYCCYLYIEFNENVRLGYFTEAGSDLIVPAADTLDPYFVFAE